MRVDREVRPFAAVLVLAGAAAWWAHPAWSILPGVLLLFTVWFFRDPERTPPADPEALLSPADGRILEAGPQRVSIFMNVFDVHVCRAPLAGEVEAVEHARGKFLAAFKDDAAERNERTTIRLVGERERLSFTLVAGLVARRIVCRVEPGRRLAAGERVGLIRFGSRVDVALPARARVAVAVGQRTVAGETILARLD